MNGDLNQTGRWLINTTGAMILSNALGAIGRPMRK